MNSVTRSALIGKSSQNSNFRKYALWGLFGIGVASPFLLLGTQTADAHELKAHEVRLPWSHWRSWQAYDHASIRRGFFVYKNVCAQCHSLSSISYRHLINVCFTPEEARAIAAESTMTDGPDDEGNMFERPGKWTDYMPKPYENDAQARFANNGSIPPDLSNIVKARAEPIGTDYLFFLLTGYRDPPAGLNLKEGQHYNPYFPGTIIAMSQALTNGMVEYPDGTEATVSQMAKDVTTFLAWASEPEMEQRKLVGLKVAGFLILLFFPALYWKRYAWSVVKSRKVRFFD